METARPDGSAGAFLIGRYVQWDEPMRACADSS